MSTVHVHVADSLVDGEFAGSTARTANVCVPSASAEYLAGLTQAVNVPSSTLHSNVATASASVNANVALWLLVNTSGPDVTTGVGV